MGPAKGDSEVSEPDSSPYMVVQEEDEAKYAVFNYVRPALSKQVTKKRNR